MNVERPIQIYISINKSGDSAIRDQHCVGGNFYSQILWGTINAPLLPGMKEKWRKWFVYNGRRRAEQSIDYIWHICITNEQQVWWGRAKIAHLCHKHCVCLLIVFVCMSWRSNAITHRYNPQWTLHSSIYISYECPVVRLTLLRFNNFFFAIT